MFLEGSVTYSPRVMTWEVSSVLTIGLSGYAARILS